MKNHPFVDGNKRVAWLAMEGQLRLHGLRVRASTAAAEELVLSVVAGKLDAIELRLWIAERLGAT